MATTAPFKPLKILSWNVNGVQHILRTTPDLRQAKGPCPGNVLSLLIQAQDPDIVCLQEIRCTPAFDHRKWFTAFPYVIARHCLSRRGYSGTLVCSKTRPLSQPEFDDEGEGRVIACEFDSFFLVNVYAPNSGRTGQRLAWRTKVWEPRMRSFLKTLQRRKPVVLIGDLNVVPTALDCFAGFNGAGATLEEKEAFATLLRDCALEDTFRELHPDLRQYSWNPRLPTRGCRLDFALASRVLHERVKRSEISYCLGSDHLPIMLELAEAAARAEASDGKAEVTSAAAP